MEKVISFALCLKYNEDYRLVFRVPVYELEYNPQRSIMEWF